MEKVFDPIHYKATTREQWQMAAEAWHGNPIAGVCHGRPDPDWIKYLGLEVAQAMECVSGCFSRVIALPLFRHELL
jgi:hypothetical protein